MKIEDIVQQLRAKLPLFSDLFTTNFSVSSLTRSSTTVTVTTSGVHSLAVNQAVNITGAETPLSVVSLTRVGAVGFIETTADQDFTFGNDKPTPNIIITGATESEFNGTFTIVGVTNRRNVQFTMVDAGPTTATGTPLVLNGTSVLQQYNGLQKITAVPTTTTFEYEIVDTTLFSPASGTIVAKTNPRIAGILSLEEIENSYTKQDLNTAYLFVTLGDVVASKNRHIVSDATDNLQRSQFFRQQIIQNTTLYVVIPAAVESIAGRQARDLSEDLFRPLCQSVLFQRFDSGLFNGKFNPLQFISHATASYNHAIYIHAYSFEQVADLQFEDTVGFSEDVAFRDIDVSMTLDIGTGVNELTAEIDLDEEPIP